MRDRVRKGRVFLLFLGLMLLIGCGRADAEENSQGSDAMRGVSEIYFLDEKTTAAGSDNKMDDLHAVLQFQLKELTIPEGMTAGAGNVFLCADGYRCIHNFYKGKERRTEVNEITPEGEERSFALDLSAEGTGTVVFGPISGEKGFVGAQSVYDKAAKRYKYLLSVWGEDYQRRQTVETVLKGISDSQPYPLEVMGDALGNFHLTYYGNGLQRYAVVSPEGRVILEDVGEYNLQLCACVDGSVALSKRRLTDGKNEWWFFKCDLETGAFQELPVSKDEKLRKKMKGPDYVSVAAPVDEYRMMLCKSDGLYLCDSREGTARLAYKWSNHGISLPIVNAITAFDDGSIGILFNEGSAKYYFVLQATQEREEVTSITFAVSSEKKEEYLRTAAYFNKRYPAYNVNVVDDWDETSLLTQLGAGMGPVLIDTAVTGFEGLEKLWQPLDDFLEQTKLSEELIPEALDFGRIGDVSYGVIRSFSIRTLLISDQGPEDWDYEGFLRALEEKKGVAPFAYWYFDIAADRRDEFFDLLKNGIDDTYYVDDKQESSIFGTAAFDRVISLSERARKCLPAEDGKAIREGRALCEVLYLYGMQQIVELRMRLEKGGERIIGYPTREGARFLLVSQDPIAMRKNATEEEKKIAYTFLKLLLSKEGMTTSKGGFFFTRWDALEDQITLYEDMANESQKQMGFPLLDREKDVPLIHQLISGSTPMKSFPASLENVFDEEIGEYLDDRIDGAALSEHLQNRFWIYLEEQK